MKLRRPQTDGPEDVARQLPLTDLAFNILLSLADRDLHGYALISEINERAPGGPRLRSGTLYAALRRLETVGLLRESGHRPAPDQDDRRRRYYEILPLGLTVLRAEVDRLRGLLGVAQSKRLFGPPTGEFA